MSFLSKNRFGAPDGRSSAAPANAHAAAQRKSAVLYLLPAAP